MGKLEISSSYGHWGALAEMIFTDILTLNCRRASEIELLLVESANLRRNKKGVNAEIFSTLSGVEKEFFRR